VSKVPAEINFDRLEFAITHGIELCVTKTLSAARPGLLENEPAIAFLSLLDRVERLAVSAVGLAAIEVG
jgi:hypothetical protein